MSLANLGYIALKRQTITTPSVAVVPTHFLRYIEGEIKLEQENLPLEQIQNNAWGATGMVKGAQTAEGSFSAELDANEAMHIIAGTMGTITSTTDVSSGTDATVLSHVIDLGNALPCFTFEQAMGDLTDTGSNYLTNHVRRAFGVYFDSFTIKGGTNGKIEFSYNFKAVGVFERAKLINNAAAGSSVAMAVDTVEGLVATTDNVSTYDDTPQNEIDAIASLSTTNKTITIATLNNSYTVANNAMVFLQPQTPSYSVAAQVFTMADVQYRESTSASAAASATEGNLENWEFTYMNNLEARAGSLRRSSYVVAPKKREAKLKYTKYFETKLDAERYFNATKRGIELKMDNGVIVSATDTGNKKYSITFALSDVRITSFTMKPSFGELLAYDVEAMCLYDSSDARAVRCTIVNASAATVYTA